MNMARLRKRNHGFVTKEMLPEIVRINRFEHLLVRCGGGLFLVPAQDADHFIQIVNKEGSDYVRDLSFPAPR